MTGGRPSTQGQPQECFVACLWIPSHDFVRSVVGRPVWKLFTAFPLTLTRFPTKLGCNMGRRWKTWPNRITHLRMENSTLLDKLTRPCYCTYCFELKGGSAPLSLKISPSRCFRKLNRKLKDRYLWGLMFFSMFFLLSTGVKCICLDSEMCFVGPEW